MAPKAATPQADSENVNSCQSQFVISGNGELEKEKSSEKENRKTTKSLTVMRNEVNPLYIYT